MSVHGIRSGKKNLEKLPMNIRLEWQLQVLVKMMTFMHTLNSESTAIFCLRFNDLTVLFHIGFWDALSNYIWIRFYTNIAFTKSESKNANFYQAVQGVRTCMKVLTPDKFEVKNNLIEIPSDHIDELLLQYDLPDLLQFGSDETVQWLEGILTDIRSPELSAKAGPWVVCLQRDGFCIFYFF